MHPGPQDRFIARKIEVRPWYRWFAWRPIKIEGRRVWFKTIYRRQIVSYVDMDDWVYYEYGTLFHILKQSQ
jgi:hypothetical protein